MGRRGLEVRRIRRCSLEQRRMAVIQLGEDALHGGFAEDGGAFLDTEAVTILLHGSQFLIVQVNNLTMGAPERSLALFEIFRIRSRRALLFPCQNRLSLDNIQTGERSGRHIGSNADNFPGCKNKHF